MMLLSIQFIGSVSLVHYSFRVGLANYRFSAVMYNSTQSDHTHETQIDPYNRQ